MLLVRNIWKSRIVFSLMFVIKYHFRKNDYGFLEKLKPPEKAVLELRWKFKARLLFPYIFDRNY